MAQSDRFLKACRREPVDCTPIWLMRQAGTHLPAYRRLLDKHGLMTLFRTPDLAVAVTRLPVDAFGVDAAIACADVALPLLAMGLMVEFDRNAVLAIRNPIRTHADIESLVTPPSVAELGFVLKGIEASSRELKEVVPVIGLAGAPFTLASFALEGGRSKHYKQVKALMYGEPRWWHRLMEKLTRQVADYLVAQAGAGARALHLFDAWVGTLSPYDFREYVLPHHQRLVTHVKDACPGVPLITFGTGGVGFLPLLRESGGDVIGIDWRMDLLAAWHELGDNVAVQGNLDPALLLGPPKVMTAQAARLLDAVGGRPGHIMNLGHGLFKETPPENAVALVEFVHRYTAGKPERRRRK
jgi:uroporphyrinogen decarboxylase